MRTAAVQRKARAPRGIPHWVLAVAGCLVLTVLLGGYFINKYWPYRYREVKPLLENVLASKITIESYHRTYFPHPGFVAHGLTLRRNTAQNLPPVGTATDLTVEGRWIDLILLRSRVKLVDVTGLHIVIPPVGSTANHQDFPAGSSADFAGPTTAVQEFHLHNAQLDIQRVNGGTYAFPIRDLVIRNLQKGKTITYAVDMQNAMPTGRIQSAGKFGPLNPNNLGGTPLSGDFTFSDVKLDSIGSIHGNLTASDHFEGVLDAIEVNATTNTPDFAAGKGRPTRIAGVLHCTVNGLNGNIVLHKVQATIGSSTVVASGSITGSPKATDLQISVDRGRVQDLMRPFLHGKVPLSGNVWLHSHVRLLPLQNQDFLQRLRADASFTIPAETLANKATEQSLSAFSLRASGSANLKGKPAPQEEAPNPDADVLSSLSGKVNISDGILVAQRINFAVPGATTTLTGTYSFRNTGVHLTGTLVMDAGISHVTTGFKSFLLKPFTPFFKKGTAGAVIPIAITGTAGNYKISQDIAHNK